MVKIIVGGSKLLTEVRDDNFSVFSEKNNSVYKNIYYDKRFFDSNFV
jgi:hypothetical protein